MKPKNKVDRRTFMGSAATGSLAFTILPRHVLGGHNYVAPSDKLTLAYIGCGKQGLTEFLRLVTNPEVQIIAVCDPEKDNTDYVEFVENELRDETRKLLEKPTWGGNYKGVRCGRDVAKDIAETYYAIKRSSESYKGCTSYADFRELLEKEKDLDSVKIMTPDHLHATISIAAMKKRKHVVMHKPLANRVYESRLVVETARKTGAATHLLAYRSGPDNNIKEMIKNGAIGTLREVHNWTDRPIWPLFQTIPTDKPPVPKSFDWNLWLGPALDRPYHPNYTHCVFRGWYDFGAGAIADMGFYSLWPIFATLDLPVPISVEASTSTDCEIVNQISGFRMNDFSFPNASQVRLRFAGEGDRPAITLYWYDGGMKPYSPEAMEEDGKGMPPTGTMYVGDKGVILGNQIFPEKRRREYMSGTEVPQPKAKRSGGGEGGADNLWVQAFKGGKPSPGTFANAANCGETICLVGAAVRFTRMNFKTFSNEPTPVLKWDAQNMKFTNVPEANQYLVREYRKGWEL